MTRYPVPSAERNSAKRFWDWFRTLAPPDGTQCHREAGSSNTGRPPKAEKAPNTGENDCRHLNNRPQITAKMSARAVPGVPFGRARAAYSIDIVAPQVRNLPVSKELKRISGRTSGLVGLWSCGLVILHPAIAFLAECTGSQTREGNLHGVCLFDRILNPPPTALADSP